MRFFASSVFQQVVSSALAAALGLLLYRLPLGLGLERLSYDFPFRLRGNVEASGIVLVYMDEESGRTLQQAVDLPWDRGLHARLLERLQAQGVRAVLFDLIFDTPGPNPEADHQFAVALRQQGSVVLSGDVQSVEQRDETGTRTLRVVSAPIPELRAAAAGWGLASVPWEADGGVRQLYPGELDLLPATEVLARLLGQRLQEPAVPRWLNFYGPPDWIPGLSYAQVMQPEGVPPGFLQGKIVLVGGRSTTSLLGGAKDEFAGPLSRWDDKFYPGLEIHATALLNRLHHTWLERLHTFWEVSILLVVAVFGGFVLRRLTPLRATAAGLAAILCLGIAAFYSVWHVQVWWAWLIPAGVQIPFSIVWAVGTQYFVEARRQRALRRAFSLYLSPHMADIIATTNFDLTPGGQLVEATIMFTDLAGFTALAEELQDPAALSALLIRYYTRTTSCILGEDGTIIKYMGDAVEAVWNAPLPDATHALKACHAADRLRQVARFDVNGRIMATRIGIHTGPAFAGNLGSEFRFDYAVIGDTTNFASRLEGMNKHFGTEILLSDATLRQTGSTFLTRPLGQIRVAGKTQAVRIHELLGPAAPEEPWLTAFREGLSAFEAGDFGTAIAALEQARATRAGGDPPSEFFLKTIRAFQNSNVPLPWTGVLEFASKEL